MSQGFAARPEPVDLTKVGGTAVSLGQKAMAASVPVVVASDQSAVPISAASLPLPTGASTSANQLPDGHNVTVDNAAGGAAVNIQDGGNAITVDGTVTAAAQPGVDIGDVKVNNAAGVSAVNVQDGGNSLTVDGTVSISGSVDTELPPAAALSDADANPTTPTVGAVGMGWNGASLSRLRVSQDSADAFATGVARLDVIARLLGFNGATFDRIRSDGDDADAEATGTLGRLITATRNYLFNGTTWDRMRGDTTTGIYAGGAVAHDAADTGNPMKVGVKAIDYDPDSDDEQGPAEVAANDRANVAANLRGERVEGVNPFRTALDNVSTTYDDSPTTATSQSIECWNYRHACIGFALTKANTPTDIIFEVEISLDGTNYFKLMNGFLGDWRYDDTAVGTSGVSEGMEFPICCRNIRLKVTATGTTASNTFTVANAYLYMRN